ncbi:MAG: hypothetical protein ACLQVG_33675 [Terriglobia bacterium]
MELKIASNSATPGKLRQYYDAIAQAIGGRAGHWDVWLSQFKPGFPLTVMINGPQGLRLCQIFPGAQQQSLQVVGATVARLIGKACGQEKRDRPD